MKEIKCKACGKILAETSEDFDFTGTLRLKCRKQGCKKLNTITKSSGFNRSSTVEVRRQ
jgi:phage FluMu protein Com